MIKINLKNLIVFADWVKDWEEAKKGTFALDYTTNEIFWEKDWKYVKDFQRTWEYIKQKQFKETVLISRKEIEQEWQGYPTIETNENQQIDMEVKNKKTTYFLETYKDEYEEFDVPVTEDIEIEWLWIRWLPAKSSWHIFDWEWERVRRHLTIEEWKEMWWEVA